MKKIFKSVFSYLLICMLFCCPITNVYADEINARIVSAEAMTISANNTYYIRNYKSNLYLDVAAPSYKELIQHSFMGGNNQRFVYQNNTLKSVHTGSYVTTGANYAADFPRAVVGSSLKISLSVNTDGTYCILKQDGNKLHMPNLSYCLVVQNASTSNLAKTIWYPYNNTYNEQWMFVKA
jgi:hypothetical protein